MGARSFLPMITLGLIVAAVIVLDRRPFSGEGPGGTAIFNGRDLTGWHQPAAVGRGETDSTEAEWLAQNGALWGHPTRAEGRGRILTNQVYGDVVVTFEMKNDFGPRSSLLLRARDSAGAAIEIPIDYREDGTLMGIRPRDSEAASGREDERSAVRSFTFGATPLEIDSVADGPTLPIPPERWRYFWHPGEWNTLRVRIVGSPPTVTTWINDLKWIEWTADAWTGPAEGHVGFAVGGEDSYTNQFVRYRRIRIDQLDSASVSSRSTSSAPTSSAAIGSRTRKIVPSGSLSSTHTSPPN